MINVLVLFTIQVVFLGVPALERLPHLLATIPYLHNALFHEDSLIDPVIWSLEVEAQFYLLTPLLTLVFCLKNVALRRAILFAGIVGFAYLAQDIPRAYLPAQMEHFLVGFLLADLYLNEWTQEPNSRCPGLWDALGTAAWISIPVLHLMLRSTFLLSILLLPFATLVAFSATFRGRLLRSFFRLRLVVIVGGMCYTFYLYHMAFLSAFSRLTVSLTPESNYYLFHLYQLLILGPLTIVGSAILFRLTERPFMNPRWPHQLWSKIRLS